MNLREINLSLLRLARHPSTRVFVALSLFITGLDDLAEHLTGSEGILNIGVYHGVTILGIQQVISSAGDMLEGLYQAAELKHLAQEESRRERAAGPSARRVDQISE